MIGTFPRRTMLALALLFAGLLISREPRLLTQAEFWGDDGWSWYPDAYNHGAASLLAPVGGYLNTVQRLGGLLSLLAPLHWAPTEFAVIALSVQVLPALLIASSRMAAAMPSAALRLFAALLYLMLPNVIEPYANLTNSQWHLAMAGCLLLIARPPAGPLGRGLDLTALTLCGLSGPFGVMLLPLAAWRLYAGRRREDAWKLGVLSVTAMVQAATFLAHPGARSAAPLGAGVGVLARIVATQVILGAELGFRSIRALPGSAAFRGETLPLAIAGGAGVLAAIALCRGGAALRTLCLFAGLLLAAALLKPQVAASAPQWPLLAIPSNGNRYFLAPMVAWVAIALSLAADRNTMLRGTGAALLAVTLGWGIPHDWRYIAFPRPDFSTPARVFERAAPNTVMSFPQLPPGATPMWLQKR